MSAHPKEDAANIVRYPIELTLPDVSLSVLQDAAEAVKQEYRHSVKCKLLRCRSVTPIAASKDGSVFVLEVAQSIEFDWTWEGAIAFRPADLQSVDGSQSPTAHLGDSQHNGEGYVWAGEVVEVDEVGGRIFVSVSDKDHPPTTGSFLVRPFEFLAFLFSIYCDPMSAKLRKHLPARLNASRGGVHPPTTSPGQPSLPMFQGTWDHQWGILWGPPGTGKTYTIGQQLAACLGDNSERILVVSTTNKATDEVALSCGRAAQSCESSSLADGSIIRIGKGANHDVFQRQELLGLLRGTETELLHQADILTKRWHATIAHEERAILKQQVKMLQTQMKDASYSAFTSGEAKVVLCTSFKAISLLCNDAIRSSIGEGMAPFTTVIIDEAGLISRATVAALSLLASRRVVLSGDPKQLAPISKISRILQPSQATWLASSGLSHLSSFKSTHPAITLLKEQHRMHPHISAVVSAYQYDSHLLDSSTVSDQKIPIPAMLKGQPRAIWYVLDEDAADLKSIRAERGPGNRSWFRPATRHVLERLFSDDVIRNAKGLFISPFIAQTREVRKYFAEESLDSWMSATVHSQQGTEADFVIFDTVNAGSCGWPLDEWKRLINVGISRAKAFVLIIASRSEMREPYLKPLMLDVAPRILKTSGKVNTFASVKTEAEDIISEKLLQNPELIGNQLERRKMLRPVLSYEQQRLCDLKLDGKPRLVRGVAGSGKTVVLANWLLKSMHRLKHNSSARLWAIYANRSLQKLIKDTIEDAWRDEGNKTVFPWDRVELCHVRDLLSMLLGQVGLNIERFQFDYDQASAEFLRRRPADEMLPLCDALFIDEAQDMGPNTLKLLSALVRQTDENDQNSRSVNIFYDNAQNIYGRSTPKWSDIGLNMKGRSSVMKESFRSTKPIIEFSLNVLYRLQSPDADTDHKELIERGLIEKVERLGNPWWDIRFNQVDGPLPTFRKYLDREDEFEAIGEQIVSWIRKEGVKPRDVRIIYNGGAIESRIEKQLVPKLGEKGIELLIEKGQSFTNDPMTVVATTAQSFKGYDAEIIVIPGVDSFVAKDVGPLASSLYVAMTRARSILAVYGVKQQKQPQSDLLEVVDACYRMIVDSPDVERSLSRIDEFEDLVRYVGNAHRDWLDQVLKKFRIEQEPILSGGREVIAEPLFWFRQGGRRFACFGGRELGKSEGFRLEDEGVVLIRPGDALPEKETVD